MARFDCADHRVHILAQCSAERRVLCNRSDAALSHAPKLSRAHLHERIRRTFTAWAHGSNGRFGAGKAVQDAKEERQGRVTNRPSEFGPNSLSEYRCPCAETKVLHNVSLLLPCSRDCHPHSFRSIPPISRALRQCSYSLFWRSFRSRFPSFGHTRRLLCGEKTGGPLISSGCLSVRRAQVQHRGTTADVRRTNPRDRHRPVFR